MSRSTTKPRFPIYIPSKGRWQLRHTVKALEAIRVAYHIIVEEQEYPAYAAVIDPANILVLDPAYQRDYDACMALEPGQSRGSGPARNFGWDHAVAHGHAWHWMVDDNIRDWQRLHNNIKMRCGDGTPFRVMEDFCLRYKNIGMAGPNYHGFADQRQKMKPFLLNTRIFSCNLIRNDIPFRWRGRYNEDADLSLRLLKAGWCTVQFNAFLQHKIQTQGVKGGNTDELYKDGTAEKSKMLARLHPDVAKVVMRWRRVHHYVDYSRFKALRLLRDPSVPIAPGVDDYGLTLIDIKERPPAVADGGFEGHQA